MPLDSNLLERLLHEEEGSALDFKQDQYAFEGTDKDVKGELLKDILAFANAWRRTTAYVLIGVAEVKGGRSNIVGVKGTLGRHQITSICELEDPAPGRVFIPAIPHQ